MAGSSALRVLALAAKPAPPRPLALSDEAGLTMLGLLGLHDPPRPEARAALETCRTAGIRVVMVTGDGRDTAEAVARDLGMLGPDYGGGSGQGSSGGRDGGGDGDGDVELTSLLPGASISGKQFAAMSASGQHSALDRLVVLSRVEPLHKLSLVEAFKSRGDVVAMTGDGVNDAPALVRANIGVAMGGGTAVARHAADVVLSDDNFATIVFAVAEGRTIYANTKQFIRYMISSNIGEVVAIFTAALLGTPEVSAADAMSCNHPACTHHRRHAVKTPAPCARCQRYVLQSPACMHHRRHAARVPAPCARCRRHVRHGPCKQRRSLQRAAASASSVSYLREASSRPFLCFFASLPLPSYPAGHLWFRARAS
eukprot:240401-Chlamydomonas_euryale.AAC.11